MKKRILIITLALILALSFTACKKDGTKNLASNEVTEEKTEKTEKLDISKYNPAFKEIDKKELEEINKLIETGDEKTKEALKPLKEQKGKTWLVENRDIIAQQDAEFAHLSSKHDEDGGYAMPLGAVYGKNMLYQAAKNEKGETTIIKSKITHPDKPTVLVFTASWCPACKEFIEDLEKTSNSKELSDFNIVFMQGRLNDTSTIEEDYNAVVEEMKEKHFPFGITQSLYGVEDLMNEVEIAYYPTLLYLDKDGYVINSGAAMDYDSLNEIFSLSN